MSAAKEKLSSLLQRLRASGKKSAVPQLLVEESKKRKSTRVVARVPSRYIPDFPHTEGGPAVSVTHTFGVVRLVVEDIILNDSAKAKDYFVTVSIGRQCLTSKSVRCPKPGIDGTARLCFKAGAEFVLQQGGATVVRVALFRQGTLDAGWSNRLIAWCEADLAAHFPIAAVPGNGTQCASATSLATPLRSACTAPGTARPDLTTTATKTADRSGSLQPTDTPTTIIHGEDLPVFEGVFDLQDKDNANVTRGTARLSGRIASLAELERQVWSQLLLLADFDGSGHLSQAEFGILLRAFGAELTEEEVAEIFEVADADKTGHCSVDELAALLAFFDHADDAATGSNGIGSSASHSRNNSDAGDPVNGSTDADADAVAGRSSDAGAREGLHPSTSFPALRTTISTESDNAFLFNKLVRRCPVDGAELSPDPSQRASNLIYVWLALSATREQHEADLRAGYKTESHAGASWMLRLSEWASHPLSRRDRRWNRTYRAGGLRVGAAANHILVFDRANRRIIEECISPVLTLAMRNLYQSKVGKTLMRQGLAKRLVALSAKEGKYRDSPESCRDIPSFVESFRGQIYIDEAERQLNEYVSFNDFFTRKLKPGSRPVAAADNPDVVVSAADCRMQVYDNIDEATRFWIKGRNFSIAGLLADDSPDRLIARRYKRGTMAIFRLAPQDYHRFHSPVDGSIVSINDVGRHVIFVHLHECCCTALRMVMPAFKGLEDTQK
jgi:hypothetical protein